MYKRPLAAFVLALPLTFAACGGDGDDSDGTVTPGDSTVTGSPAASVTVSPTPETVLPTPTPLNEQDPLLSIVANGTAITPTAADFNAWPQSTITAGGEEYTGVSLTDLAAAAGATGTFVEIEGVRSDGVRYAITRHVVADVGDTSLIVLRDTGQLDFVSSTVDAAQWMTAITAISFI